MDALTVLVHWLYLLALVLWVGGLAVLLLVLPAGRRVRPEDVVLLESARQRTQAVLWWSIIALLATLAAETLLRTLPLVPPLSRHGGDFRDAVKLVLLGSRFGIAALLRWVLLVVALLAVDELGRTPAAVSVRAVRRGPQALGIVAGRPSLPRIAIARAVWLRVAVIAAIGMLICTAVAGRYGGAPLAVLAETLHLGATALWLGGAIALALVVAPYVPLVPPERRPLALLLLLGRFSPLAVLGTVVLALAGAWEAAQRFHGFSTPFGRAVTARALVLLLVVGISAWSVLVVRPRLRRLTLRARRDAGAAARAAMTLTLVRRLLWTTPPLAALALLLGAVADAAPDRAVAPRHGPPIVRQHAGATATPVGWQELGPVLIAHSLVADPANHARLFEGTTSGVFRSTDGGHHWAPASTGLSGGATEVWSLTFIPDGSLIAATGAGLYRSTDGGAHWRPAGLSGRSIYTLAVHVAGHIVLLAGGDGGIFRSDDVAATWQQVYDSGSSAVSSLAWPSMRPSVVVAGINPGPASIALSHDGGATWQAATAGLPVGPGMMSVAVAPGAQDVYAGTMGLGTYISHGLSGRWQGRNDGLPGLAIRDAHIGGFAFDPSSPRTIYSATDFGVYWSRDAGRHWAPFGSGLRGYATVVTSLTLVTGARPVLYATTAAGVYRLPLSTAATRSR